jgi:hypothetical protein
MNIKHDPRFDTNKVIKHYEEKDKVSISYCCTSELVVSDIVIDVFYRSTPHPEFGNRYFGLFSRDGNVMIINADVVETLDFAMITDKEGTYHYSESRHDYKEIDGNMIDGGRAYIRCNTGYELFKVKDGQFVRIEG